MKSWKSIAAAAALAVVAAACGSDAPTAPHSSSSTLDLSTVFAQMSMGNADAMPGARAATGVPFTGTAPAPSSASCAYSGATQGFTCAPATVDGIKFTLSYWLYDAAGHALDAPDASKTASVRTVTDAAGTLALAGVQSIGESIALTEHSDMTLSGLLSNGRTLNGTSASHYDISFSASTPVHSVMDDSSVTTNVVVPTNPTDGQYWPASGTIASTMHMVTTSQSLPSISMTNHILITFDGTSRVKFTLTADGGSPSTCTIDLSGKTPPVCS